MEPRIIGRYGGQNDGPLLICIGGIHGNETAGVEAINEVFRLLSVEREINPGFAFHGTLIGVRGNLRALAEGKRYIDRDLNRMLSADDLQVIKRKAFADLSVEEKECIELISLIDHEVNHYSPAFTLVLDFHTTTADGGLFTIAADEPVSRNLAMGLHVPVILGIAEGLHGTTISYFNQPEKNCYCLVFEAGQTQDPGCVDRSIAAIINCMRKIRSVRESDVHHRHDDLLIQMSLGLPKMTRLLYHHKLSKGEIFTMKPGYKNFQPIVRGEELGWSGTKIVHAPCNGLILMPKYQPLGEDAFFIVEAIEVITNKSIFDHYS